VVRGKKKPEERFRQAVSAYSLKEGGATKTVSNYPNLSKQQKWEERYGRSGSRAESEPLNRSPKRMKGERAPPENARRILGHYLFRSLVVDSTLKAEELAA